jgi:hypothetical protein
VTVLRTAWISRVVLIVTLLILAACVIFALVR